MFQLYSAWKETVLDIIANTAKSNAHTVSVCYKLRVAFTFCSPSPLSFELPLHHASPSPLNNVYHNANTLNTLCWPICCRRTSCIQLKHTHCYAHKHTHTHTHIQTRTQTKSHTYTHSSPLACLMLSSLFPVEGPPTKDAPTEPLRHDIKSNVKPRKNACISTWFMKVETQAFTTRHRYTTRTSLVANVFRSSHNLACEQSRTIWLLLYINSCVRSSTCTTRGSGTSNRDQCIKAR